MNGENYYIKRLAFELENFFNGLQKIGMLRMGKYKSNWRGSKKCSILSYQVHVYNQSIKR